MGSLSDYAENALLGHVFGSAHSPSATVYLALCTADPTDAGTGGSMNEVANSNNYARKALTFSAASSRRVTQSGNVVMNEASGSWGTVTHWAAVSSGTHGAGNMLAYGSFASSFAVSSGKIATIVDGTIWVQIDAVSGKGATTYLANKLLDLMFRNTAYSQPSTYIALLDSTGADTDTTLTTSGKEIAGTAYARKLVNKTGGASPAWGTVSGGAVTNNDAITFATVGSGGWSLIVAMAIVDAGTLDTGNVLMYDNNVTDQTPAADDVVTFSAGALDVSLS